MASSGTLASPSNQIDKLQDPPPPALGSSSASLGLEPPNLRGCDTEIVSLPASDTVPSMPHDLTAVVEASSPLEISLPLLTLYHL
ncbi:hypothetical protein F2Q68_00002124 [Brassica cretica]|uniref:Uncharacterized protein n=1 Tax=Brassica cretica TaxID=69181 RepID=A0A8S9JJA6_BRACR|nr:hypothetical protein F2Q68_00002124 [Brassica cretica]